MTDTTESAELAGIDYGMLPHDMVVSGIDRANSVNEDALARRYGRLTKKKEELVFEFTRDPALIHQYYRIYEDEFKSVLSANYHHDNNDEHDRRGYFLIARRGKLCIGGARLNVKTPRQPHLLPVEMGDFRIEGHFPDLGLKEMRYGQIGRLCLLPEYRGGPVTRTMMWHLFRKSVALNLDMIFATAPLIIARGHMKTALAMGLKQTKIHTGITLPPYPMCEEIRFFLMSVVIDKSLIGDSEPVVEKMQLKENEKA